MSLLKFDNKLELRYLFNDSSTYIDAQVHFRCEREVLTLLYSLADLLDVQLRVYYQTNECRNGFREVWSIAGEDSRSISIIINLTIQMLRQPTLNSHGKLMDERKMEDGNELQKKLALLRRDLKLKKPALCIPTNLVALLNRQPNYCKYKSNFYEALRGYPKVTGIQLRELNGRNLSRSGRQEIRREQFDNYILRSNKLPPIIDKKAIIEIISPVLKDTKYRWKGIYNKGGQVIDFYMEDEDFKKQMLEDKISFASGIYIECVMEISRRLSELGDPVNVCYTVTTVIRTRTGKMELLTPQGKRWLRKQEGERKQLSFDF
ncbi:MAG: hypothetical protein ACI30I_12235 [Parabacteroides sp.]